MPLKFLLRGATGLLAGCLLCVAARVGARSASAQTSDAQTSSTTQISGKQTVPAQPVAALSPFIDVHTHMDHVDAERSGAIGHRRDER